jgi:NADPH:quinone reductase-like Zn-dependent oxidoreductase
MSGKTMRRIVRFYETGGPEVLRLEEAAPEPPRADEVLIRVQAIGLNNSEAQLRRGDYPMLMAQLPSRIGRECSGIVDAVGASVTSVRPGDLVSTIPAFDVQRHGVYGEWCVVPEVGVTRTPDRLTRIEAAAVWQQYLTAYGPLMLNSQLGPEKIVLITAGASSVGLGAIQIAKLSGARVIATTRSVTKVRVIQAAGADHVIVMGSQPFPQAIKQATDGRGFDICLDPIAGNGLLELVDAAAPEAIIHLYGQLSTDVTPLPLIPLLRKGLSIRGYTLWEITLNAKRRTKALAFIFERLQSGALRPVIDKVMPLDEIIAAHRYLESGRQAGKIVIDIGGGAS